LTLKNDSVKEQIHNIEVSCCYLTYPGPALVDSGITEDSIRRNRRESH